MSKLWGGRFEGANHPLVEEFTRSLELDRRLCAADLRGSIAHVEMLGEEKIVAPEEAKHILSALTAMLEDECAGKLALAGDAEDIHSAIERELGRRIGPLAGKMHTARSRNDQVATACRLYLRGELEELHGELSSLMGFLLREAGKHTDSVLPGFTHLQHAQPVSLAHHLLAYFWMLERDRARLRELHPRLNTLPLGSGALAGTSLPIRRESVQRKLGFAALCENSLDAVSDRDFVVEFLAAAALIVSHLSRISEELVLWSCPEFGFVELSDAVTTGSSLMPQKKNPDVAELIRGRSGRLSAALVGALTMLKGLPLSYNRDLQEDKLHLFQGLDCVRSCTRLMRLMLENARWNTGRMRRACQGDQSNATDVADYLVRKGVAFREAHEIAGKAVRRALERSQGVEELPLAELQALHAGFAEDLFPALSPEAVMRSRNSRGGTGNDAVARQLELAGAAWKEGLWKRQTRS